MDQFLAASLRDGSTNWPPGWTASTDANAVVERILYHGIAGLLVARQDQIASWPPSIVSAIRERAMAQAAWELRHRLVLSSLFEGLADASVPNLVLKGTAVAYDLYESPALRARGDTDLLAPKDQIERAREVLRKLGFEQSLEPIAASSRMKLQESWYVGAPDGSVHVVDLHWHALNAPALREVLNWEVCWAGAAPLPNLAQGAHRPSRPVMLIHACAHQMMHETAPYFVDGATYYGGDRLIWIHDIHCLSGSLTDAEWSHFCTLTAESGLGPICLQSLMKTVSVLGSNVPVGVLSRLRALKGAETSKYLRASRLTRARMDFRATKGWSDKIEYLRARAFPPRPFMRAKYPQMAGLPIALLHGRRILDLFRRPKARKAPGSLQSGGEAGP